MIATKLGRLFQLLKYHQSAQLARRFRGVVGNQMRRQLPIRYRPKTGPVWLREVGAKDSNESRALLSRLRRRRRTLWPHRQTPNSLRAILNGEFRFLNQTRSLTVLEDGPSSSDSVNSEWMNLNWQIEAPRLWRFHLHYHEWLLDLADEAGDAAAWRLVQSWLNFPSHQSPCIDADAWHPYCLSVRLPSWLMLAASSDIPPVLADKFWQSISEQVHWLWQHIEWDLGGNHLIENLRTLAIADATLGGDIRIDRSELYRWIDREIDTQVLDSGEHVERTPTYHALMLLAIIEIADSCHSVNVQCQAPDAAKSMAEFLASILHPDQQIPLFGDSVFDETPSPRRMIDEILNDPIGSSRNSEAPKRNLDYWVWTSPDQANRLIFDSGNAGCDHLPAHAHADLLTFEASAFNERLIVDTGTFDYEDTPERHHCRSTLSHNTSRIDNQSHCDVWSRFRMGRRGHVLGRQVGLSSTHAWCLAAHDAYRHLGIAKTYRLIVADRRRLNGFCWLIVDWFDSDKLHTISSPLHIGSSFDLGKIGEMFSIFLSRTTEPRSVFVKTSQPTILSACDHYPNFGVRVPIHRLEQTLFTDGSTPLIWSICSNGYGSIPAVEVSARQCIVRWQGESLESLTIPIELSS